MVSTETTAANVVKDIHPGALCAFNHNSNGFKVYKDAVTWVALSKTHPTQAQAWEEAADTIKAKQT